MVGSTVEEYPFTVEVVKGIFIYQGKTKKAGESFGLISPEVEDLVVLRDIIEGVLLGNLKAEKYLLEDLTLTYLRRTGKDFSGTITLKVEEGLLRLTEDLTSP